MKTTIDGGLELSRFGELSRVSGLSGIFAGRYVKSYNRRRTPHYHDFTEIELVEAGHGFCTVNGKRFELSAGDLFFIRTTDVHGYELDKGESLTVRTLRFSGELDEALRDELYTPDILAAHLPKDETVRLITLIDECTAELKTPDRFTPLLFGGVVNRICAALLRYLDGTPEHSAPSLTASAAAIIKREFRRSLSVTSIAERLGVSANHLGRSFKAELGITLNRYLMRVRLSAASSQLLHTKLSLKQIAIECGFSSASVFSREFKRELGASPSEYREASSNRG